jgi:glycosyltransferase involved in cell wall biosynthesis
MSPPFRAVIVAPVIPFDASPHAGGLYLRHLVRVVDAHAELVLVVPNTPANREAVSQPGAPRRIIVAGGKRLPTWAGRGASRILSILDRRLRRLDPGLPSLGLAGALLAASPIREAIRRADVVDLQWSESIRLVRLVRWVNPRARIVGTYHDVQSQLFSREPSTTLGERAFRRLATWQARRHERRGVAALDEVAVFSEKDAQLLGDPATALVIHPPLASGVESFPTAPAGLPTALFVAWFAREENDEAAQWLIREVWPAVVDAVPDARLRLVGRGVSEPLQALCDARADVTVAGFVPDLEPEYAAARVCVVPLRQGAGVKFKTVEALLHGVPVVTTPVGAEGIGGPNLFAGLTSDAATFGEQMADVLADPARARQRSRWAQEWAAREYSSAGFEAQVLAHYGIG